MMQVSTAWALLFAVLSVLVGWVYLIRKKKAAEEERKWEGRAPLPPGTFGLPVLGETLALLKSSDSSSLSFFTQRIAKYGECVLSEMKSKSRIRCTGRSRTGLHERVLMLPINLPGFPFHKAKLARKVLLRTLGLIITRRRQDLKDGKVSPSQDLLSVLISNPDENGQPMSDEAIKDNIVLLLFAGHETSSTTMTLVLKYLSLNSECLKVVIQEQQEIAKDKAGGALSWEDTRRMKYTWRCVQETLRIQPVVSGAFRVGIKDFEYENTQRLVGSMECITVTQVSRVLSKPEQVRSCTIRRLRASPYTYIPFGGGPHFCLGQEFAKVEMLVLLHYLVLNYEWSMVDPKEKVHVKPVPMFERELQLTIRKREIPLV